ncbi:MAG: ABC transporter ATP-binding protein [Spirochaetaceae bacterium]|nr:MAG: ABC transporter ATP-binding protein [Spirochaetaceae bacterium]
MTRVHIEGVSKSYDAHPVLHAMDLLVDAGCFFTLLGPSGCGKTTLLRLIAGLLDPDAGDIRFDGESVLSRPPEARNIGMVFQQHVLFPHMTVEENVAFGLRMRGTGIRDARPKVNDVLEMVQLSGYNRRFPRQLSGGQQQRVALARAVVIDPVLLLLDEPLSNLDARLRDDMRALLRTVQRSLGITTICVTHDQTEAIELSDRMAVMFDGKIAQEGSPAELFEQPVSAMVAEFLGSTNLIPARLLDSSHAETAFGAVHVRSCPDQLYAAKQDVLLNIRCEHIAILPAIEDADAPSLPRLAGNHVAAEVVSSVYRGGLVFYRMNVDGTVLSVIDRSDRQFVPGARVVLRIPPEHVSVIRDDERTFSP